MHKLTALLLAAASAQGADSAWQKVMDVKSGYELRVYRTGSPQPLSATLEDADSERIVVTTKKEQMAIPRAEIERIDARPLAKKTRGKVVTTTTSKTVDPDYTPHPQPGLAVPQTSSSTSVSLGSGGGAEFETIYRKTAESTK